LPHSYFPISLTQAAGLNIISEQYAVRSMQKGLPWPPYLQVLIKTLFAGCSKTLRYKAPEIPRSETYSPVRRNDEG
jgi:hypothetical protein